MKTPRTARRVIGAAVAALAALTTLSVQPAHADGASVDVTTYNVTFGRDGNAVANQIINAMGPTDVLLLQEAQYNVQQILNQNGAPGYLAVLQDNSSSSTQGSAVVYDTRVVSAKFSGLYTGVEASPCPPQAIQKRWVRQVNFVVNATSRKFTALDAHLPPQRCADSAYATMIDNIVARVKAVQADGGNKVIVGADWNRNIGGGAGDPTSISGRTSLVPRGVGTFDGFHVNPVLNPSNVRTLGIRFDGHEATTVTITP